MQFSRNCFFFYCNTFTIRHLKLASLFCTFFRITNSISALGMRSCCLKVWNFKFGMIHIKFQSEGATAALSGLGRFVRVKMHLGAFVLVVVPQWDRKNYQTLCVQWRTERSCDAVSGTLASVVQNRVLSRETIASQ